jgi:hypothetical protein
LVLALFQTAVSIADTHFVGRLGTDALAGLALVFPLAMLQQRPERTGAGGLYLRSVAPFYALFTADMALYFAAQGAGRVGVPMLAGTARLAVVAAGGVIVVQAGAPLAALFGVIAFGIALFGPARPCTGRPGKPRLHLGRRRVDDLAHARDAVRRESTAARVLLDQLRRRGVVDAVDLVVHHVALHPLDLGAERIQDAHRLLGNGPQFLRAELARARQFTLDHEFRHRRLLGF